MLMPKKPPAPKQKEASQLTEYAQGVIEILKRLGVITALLTLPTTAFLVTQQDVRQAEIFLAQAERTATLTVDPERSTVIQGELFKVRVNLDTGGTQITEGRAVLRYNQELIKVEDIVFAPVAKDNTVDINNDTGRAEIRSFFNADAPGYFSGQTQWFEVVLSTHNEGVADFWFDCRRDAEDETNIYRFGGGDIVNCSNLGQGWYTINVVNRSAVDQNQTSCGATAPTVPGNFTVQSGPGRGEVTLKWDKVANATHYTVSYGSGPGSYQYGSPDVGDTNQFVVRGLVPGRQYYFVATAVNDCASSGYTNIVSTTAGYGAISKTTYDFSGTEKGYQPPIPPEFLPGAEEEATEGAGIVSSPRPSVSPRPSSEAVQPVTKPWERLDFWLLAGGIALGGFLLILIGSLLGRTSRRVPPVSPKPGELGKKKEEPLPPSPWEQEQSSERIPTAQSPSSQAEEQEWPPPPPPKLT